jgi:glyoxylase I family protein
MTTTESRPALSGFHHVAVTASDVEASADWYQRVFGMTRVPSEFPHHGTDAKGYTVVLVDPETGMSFGVVHHPDNSAEPADETRCGIDHVGIAMTARADLDAWAGWLDSLGIAHSGVTDAADPMPYAALVFRDPDNVQLELFYMDMSG